MRWFRAIVASVFGLLLVAGASTSAEVCKGSKVPKAALADYDAQVVLSPDDQATALQTHLPYGQPTCPTLLPNRDYILCYDPVNRVALWAAYKWTAEVSGRPNASMPSALTLAWPMTRTPTVTITRGLDTPEAMPYRVTI